MIVVDDSSTDATAAIAAQYPVMLIRMPEHSRVAAARNRAVAIARAPLLLFIDADVTLDANVLVRGRADMAEPGAAAVIGSYDDEPADRSMVSMFKNLAHHYFHQRSGPYVTTFWGACGFIRRDLFLSAGGFNEQGRGITDVELGYGLTARGIRIRLDPELKVKHLKRWTLGLLLRTELGIRAIPWTRLMLEYRHVPSGLNFAWDQRVAAILAYLMVAFLLAAFFRPEALLGLAVCFALAVYINRNLYALFFRKGGLRLLIAGFLLQQGYYIYSLVGLALGIVLFFFRKLRARSCGEVRLAVRETAPGDDEQVEV